LSRDSEVHTHRVGRTGRAGKAGIACSLYDESEEFKISQLEEVLGETLPRKRIGQFDPAVQPARPSMVTLQIDGGKKQKVRAGDILGALTSEKTIDGSAIGKISIFDLSAFVAVDRAVSKQALEILNEQKIKGRKFRARKI
jgi:ATP-independent RNA helicase DbpA